jgi:TrmH family RNA methyltransferase
LETSKVNVKAIYTTDISKVYSFKNTIEISLKDLERISSQKNPNIALAVCEIPTAIFNANKLKNKLTLVLDDIRDPGNLGTIIRIADWFGIQNIICSEQTVDVFNPKVVQSTMGSISRVNVFYNDLSEFFNNINEIPVYGAFMDGQSIYTIKKNTEAIIVIGNESQGISTNIEKFVTNKITVPAVGQAESLNAAVATGIICSHFRVELKKCIFEN